MFVWTIWDVFKLWFCGVIVILGLFILWMQYNDEKNCKKKEEIKND